MNDRVAFPEPGRGNLTLGERMGYWVEHESRVKLFNRGAVTMLESIFPH